MGESPHLGSGLGDRQVRAPHGDAEFHIVDVLDLVRALGPGPIVGAAGQRRRIPLPLEHIELDPALVGRDLGHRAIMAARGRRPPPH